MIEFYLQLLAGCFFIVAMAGYPCCCRCCCATWPSSYTFTLSGLSDDPFNEDCCVCDDLNATFTLDYVGSPRCDGDKQCGIYMSAPFSTCHYSDMSDAGTMVAYLYVPKVSSGSCLGILQFALYSSIDPDTFCIVNGTPLDAFCTEGGARLAEYDTSGSAGGVYPEDCLVDDMVMALGSQGPCAGWPSSITLSPTP